MTTTVQNCLGKNQLSFLFTNNLLVRKYNFQLLFSKPERNFKYFLCWCVSFYNILDILNLLDLSNKRYTS